MSARNDVPPSTVGVELLDHGVEVEYTDGRTTLYRGVPEPVTDTLTTPPKKETHVLVTDPTETEGVMMYVNDLKTHDDVLESTGVGRVILDDGEEEEVFPGVTVRRPGGMRTEVEADPEVARGRVFVFVEDDWSEQSYEFVTEGADADGEDTDNDATTPADSGDA
ncbi:DUF5796 family protein [Halobellus inordinatus]|uniref:DUF5796 family protein n=1 Tax=Halobellus inordinatus TaxID=1126236 RepID=UPI00211461C1|nr:DUF5796 family protein [Halobellus ramosii]